MTSARISRVWGTILLTITIFSLSLPAYAQYSGGTGEPNDPYQIATAADLIALGETPEDYGKHFLLTADIDLDPNLPGRKVFDKAVIAPDTDSNDLQFPAAPFFSGTSFTGVFDGDGHVISHLTIKGSSYLGLFGSLGLWDSPVAEVRNLGMAAVNTAGSGDFIGAVVGFNQYQGSVIQCHSTGTVSGTYRVAGLVGESQGTVIQCYSTGKVSGAGAVGGLVGVNTGMFNGWGRVAYCYSTSAVTGDSWIGGLVGQSDGEVTGCYSTGAVGGVARVGGLVGSGWDLTNCYSTAAVTGIGQYVGGLAGYHCEYGNVTNCFWDIQTSGQATSAGGTGKTTAEMQTAKTFLDAGWDFVGETPNGSEDIWKIAEGLGYPRFSWEKYSGGTGEPNDPYQIATAADLIALGETPEDYDKHFILTADIDLDPNLPGGKVFDKAVVGADTDPNHSYPNFQGSPFTGCLHGNGHTISRLTIRGGPYLGLFGLLGDGAKVSNLGLEAVQVNGTGDCVGTLVGYNYGSIAASYASGSVSGEYHVGGLVGYNSAAVTHCYSVGAVSGVSSIGGLVGSNSATVTSCYSVGAVSGTRHVGGLVGTGPTGVLKSVWDRDTSGLCGSVGGVGLATTEMMDPYMLGLNGFANDPDWVLDTARDYPRLAWEGTPGSTILGPVIDWLDGQGTEEAPYGIDTASQLTLLGKASILWDKHFVLRADIDLDPNLPNGQAFGQALIPTLTGILDGGGHAISHLTITGEDYIGLFGLLEPGAEVRNLGLAGVKIAGSGRCVGALVGRNNGNLVHCYSTGAVSGGEYVGGLVGFSAGSILSCYCTGAVSGVSSVGGLVGFAAIETTGLDVAYTGRIFGCYSAASVSGDEGVGGFVGSKLGGQINGCFWDTQTSGRTTSASGIGKTTAEMQMRSTFTDAGWDFVGETANGMEDIWWILEGKDYPRLWWEKYSAGNGTPDDPYQIATPGDLIVLGESPEDYGKHFILTADIDLDPNVPGRKVFDKALIAPAEVGSSTDRGGQDIRGSQNIIGISFEGVFDGNGHRIFNLAIEGESCLGLFGQLGPGAKLSNLGLETVHVSGAGDYVGGLVGVNRGSVTQSYSSGVVRGSSHVGGLVGSETAGVASGRPSRRTIADCYSTATVIATEQNAGGLVGYNGGTVLRCYSTGPVAAASGAGGLVGRNVFGDVTACFWDTQTSGQTTSDGGIGESTTEMQMASTFLDAGWDFVDETANGTEDIWWLLEGQDYPRLWWESTE